MKSILLSLVLLSAGCLAQIGKSDDFQRITVDRKVICIRSGLPIRESVVGGVFGGVSRGVWVQYPLSENAESEGKRNTLRIFVRPIGSVENSLPKIDESSAVPLSGVAPLRALPKDNTPYHVQRIAGPATSSGDGQFVAECRELVFKEERECSRPFKHEGIAGAYYFGSDDLREWQSMDAALARAFASKDIGPCTR
jgi:hypothetical protein